jgi:hypothetical protein
MNVLTFVVKNYEKQQPICIEDESNFLELKRKIIDEYNLKTKYIDIKFLTDKPCRIMGKFNMEPGLLSRTFDNYTINRMAYKHNVINIEIDLVDNYDPSLKKKVIKKQSTSKYRPPGLTNIESGSTYIQPDFDLNSESDFPTL